MKKKVSVMILGQGNTGSALDELIPKFPEVDEITLVDHDTYEERNLSSQAIQPCDVGRAKVAVQARKIKRINPKVRVRAVQARLEDLPHGLFRVNAVFSCLDSKASRREAAQRTWRQDRLFIDVGVDAVVGRLARVTVYLPGEERPCIECSWSDRDYQDQGKVNTCGGDQAAPTQAPLHLGTLGASLQAEEFRKYLDGDMEHMAIGREILVDARNHLCRVMRFNRNPGCRFDHETYQVEGLPRSPAQIRLSEALGLGLSSTKGPLWLEAEGHSFTRTLRCGVCGASQRHLYLTSRLKRQPCRRCNGTMAPLGFDSTDRLESAALDSRHLAAKLSSLGFRDGDLLSVGRGSGRPRHFLLGSLAGKG